MVPESFQLCALMVAGLCLAYALFLGLGGRALFGTRERPKRIIGRRAQLSSIESGPKGLDPDQPRLPTSIIDSYSPSIGYRLVFDSPITWLGKTEDHAFVSARHVGYPLSLAVTPWRRGVFVHRAFGSGEQFIGVFSLLREHASSL